jgi:hypothetical protein
VQRLLHRLEDIESDICCIEVRENQQIGPHPSAGSQATSSRGAFVIESRFAMHFEVKFEIWRSKCRWMILSSAPRQRQLFHPSMANLHTNLHDTNLEVFHEAEQNVASDVELILRSVQTAAAGRQIVFFLLSLPQKRRKSE